MKNLKRLLKDWSPDEAEAFRIKAKEWLEQKRQEIVVDSDLRCVVYSEVKTQAKLIDELLEELNEN